MSLTPTVVSWASKALLVAAIVGGFFYYRHSLIASERAKVNAEWAAKETNATAEAINVLNNKNAEIAKRQEDLLKLQGTIVAQNKELANVKQDYENLRAQYANNSKRLSVATANNKTNTASKVDPTTTSSGTSENRVELMPDVSTEILDFARGYQENLRLKNECIDLYNSAKNSIDVE